jgi:uncharacterized protein YjiS (DUF1127 family)
VASSGLDQQWEINMAYTKTRGYQASKRRLFGPALDSIATMIAAFRLRRRTRATRRAIADLTPDQLNDIGQPEAPRPMLDVKAGVMTNLMSMR